MYSANCQGHLVERNAVKQDAHVFDGVDGNAGHPDIPRYAWVVGVVCAVCRQIEGDRQALLTGGECPAIERVALLCGREAGGLSNGPRPAKVPRG